MSALLKADPTGRGRWAFFDAGHGNVEVVIYDLDSEDEAVDTALVDFPDLPVLDFWWSEERARIVVLGFDKDDC